MFFKQLVFILIILVLDASGQNATDDNDAPRNECNYILGPALVIKNRTQELRCCQAVVKNLYNKWPNQRVYLSRTLATLKAWNCPQFEEVCSNRLLAFTEFTSLVYDRFCNESSLIQKCGSMVSETLSATGVFNNETLVDWTLLAGKLESSRLSAEQQTQSCIQVALYDSKNGGWENYVELITFLVPYCNTVWCGFDVDTIEREGLNSWKCLPTRCKANVIVLTSVLIILAVLVVFANVTVLLVYLTEKKLRHSQGIFRLSLGVADLMTGLILFPVAANSLWKTYQGNFEFLPPVNVSEELFFSNENVIYLNTSGSINSLESRISFVRRLFPGTFLDSIGFFTTLSLTVSIYLLTVSGIDRLQAITRPIQYRQHTAKRFAIVCSVFCWVLAIIVSALPIFVNGIYYILTGSGLVTLTGLYSLILYTVGFFIPLLATWIISIAMFVQGKKSYRRRASMSTVRQKHINQQRKLNFILSLMVIAFSLSIFPTILVLILVLFIPGTDPAYLESYNPLFNNLTNSLETTAVIVLMSNSLWNCLIYSLRTKTFRKTAIKKYKSIWRAISPFNLWKLLKRYSNNHKHHSFSQRGISRSFSSSVKTNTTRLESGMPGSHSDDMKVSPIAPKKFRYRNPSVVKERSTTSN